MFSIRGQSVKIEKIALTPGLYFVATPIGSARDITLRALDTLASADVLAAEDTRTLRRLMQIHGVALGEREVIAYHDHNGASARPKLMRLLQAGKSVAYASEAGTPLMADPGYQLARDALDSGLLVTSAPGPSAIVAALTIAGLPTDRFTFLGFAPNGKSARKTWLDAAAKTGATTVIYESAKRIHGTLGILYDQGYGERQVAICRELTKRFEEVIRGTVADVAQDLEGRTLKGEIVLILDRGTQETASDQDMETALLEALKTMTVKDSASEVAKALNLPKRDVYQAALSLGKRT